MGIVLLGTVLDVIIVMFVKKSGAFEKRKRGNLESVNLFLSVKNVAKRYGF